MRTIQILLLLILITMLGAWPLIGISLLAIAGLVLLIYFMGNHPKFTLALAYIFVTIVSILFLALISEFL